MKPKLIRGIVYNVYFDSMYREPPREDAVVHCVVIASNLDDAFRKVKAIFPKETINSIHTERNSFSGGPVREDSIIL